MGRNSLLVSVPYGGEKGTESDSYTTEVADLIYFKSCSNTTCACEYIADLVTSHRIETASEA